MDFELADNLGSLRIIAQRILIGPVARENSVTVLPGRKSFPFLVGGYRRWRDPTHPTCHQRQGGYTFRAIDSDTLGIGRIQNGTTIAVEDLGKVTDKSFVLRPLPEITILRFGWGVRLGHRCHFCPGSWRCRDDICAVVDQPRIGTVRRSPYLAIVGTTCQWPWQIIRPITGRPLIVQGNRPAVGSKLSRPDDVHRHNINGVRTGT